MGYVPLVSMLVQVVQRETVTLGGQDAVEMLPFPIQTVPWQFLFLSCHLTVPVSSDPHSATVKHRACAAPNRTQFSVSSIQLKCFTIFPFYLAFVIEFPVSQFSCQQREGENDGKYLIKIKCHYDLISAQRTLSSHYEASRRVPESLTQSDCGPVIPPGCSKCLRNVRFQEITKI